MNYFSFLMILNVNFHLYQNLNMVKKLIRIIRKNFLLLLISNPINKISSYNWNSQKSQENLIRIARHSREIIFRMLFFYYVPSFRFTAMKGKYSCDHCEYTATHPSNLKRHIVIKHDGVRILAISVTMFHHFRQTEKCTRR